MPAHVMLSVDAGDRVAIREAIDLLQRLLQEAAPAAAPTPAPAAEPVKTYSGVELRKVASDVAKQIGVEKVKALVASFGVKSVVDIEPERSAEFREQLLALAA